MAYQQSYTLSSILRTLTVLTLQHQHHLIAIWEGNDPSVLIHKWSLDDRARPYVVMIAWRLPSRHHALVTVIDGVRRLIPPTIQLQRPPLCCKMLLFFWDYELTVDLSLTTQCTTGASLLRAINQTPDARSLNDAGLRLQWLRYNFRAGP